MCYRKFSAICLIVYALVVCATSIEAQRKTTLRYGSSNYYSIKTLLETLPYEYDEERQLLNQWSAANENQDKIIETVIATVIASIRNKL